MRFRLALMLSLLLSANLTFADKMKRYEVSITNVTKGQTFTPQFVATHKKSVSLFTLGQPASMPLELLAEGGDTVPLTEHIQSFPDQVGEVITVPGLLAPGQTTTFEINGHHIHNYLSLAAMLLPTNDSFVALSTIKLPKKDSVSYSAVAYDAGTEKNDQNCAHIPGPHCGGAGEPHSEASEMDEGYVYIGNGFHNLGDEDDEGNVILGPALYDWNNAVALVTIKRIKQH